MISIFPSSGEINKSESLPAQKPLAEITVPSFVFHLFFCDSPPQTPVKKNTVPSMENIKISKSCVLFWLGKCN